MHHNISPSAINNRAGCPESKINLSTSANMPASKTRSLNTRSLNTHSAIMRQGGYALISIITALMILGAIATGGVTLSSKTERLAGNSIQRSRSFQAADGAATLAQAKIENLMKTRAVVNETGSNGIFSYGKRDDNWWRAQTTDATHVADQAEFLGVIAPPTYSIEQVGNYVSDGGTGITNLDIGGSAYGRITAAGREFLLFSVESHGKGSYKGVETVVETTVAYSY